MHREPPSSLDFVRPDLARLNFLPLSLPAFSGALLALLLMPLGACQPATEAPETEEAATEEPADQGPAAENPELGIALAGIPEGFELVTNEGSELRLAASPPQQGDLWVELQAPEIGGVNLVQAVNDLRPFFLQQPDGEFKGQVELGTQFGPAYNVRGRYSREGEMREQLRLVSLAPSGVETLTLVYDYPAGNDTKERINQLFGLFGELQALYGEPASDENVAEPSADADS